MGGSFGEDMTFCQRAYNLFNTLVYMQFNYWPMEQYRKMFESNYPGFPDIQVCRITSSMVQVSICAVIREMFRI